MDPGDLNDVQEFIFNVLREVQSTASGDGPKHAVLESGVTSLSLTVKVREVEVRLELSSNIRASSVSREDPIIMLHIQPGGSCKTS